jgi:HSP20 family protein
MPNLIPAQWKETLERVQDKTSHFLDKLKPVGKSDTSLESMSSDLLPAFMQFGGPPLDMHESTDELIIRVEVPGLKKNDFSVELVGSRLVIHGEKKASREQKIFGRSYLSECSYGSFTRSVQLPYDVQESKIKAELKGGILTIRMPKPQGSERPRHHQVPIT